MELDVHRGKLSSKANTLNTRDGYRGDSFFVLRYLSSVTLYKYLPMVDDQDIGLFLFHIMD